MAARHVWGAKNKFDFNKSSYNRLAWFVLLDHKLLSIFFHRRWKKHYKTNVAVAVFTNQEREELLLTYPSNFWGPGHYDGVGDSCGQSDQWGNVDGSAGPLWFHAIFGRRQISLVKNNRNTTNDELVYFIQIKIFKRKKKLNKQRCENVI